MLCIERHAAFCVKYREKGTSHYKLDEGQQFFLDQAPDFLLGQSELGIGEDPEILPQDFFGDQDRDAA